VPCQLWRNERFHVYTYVFLTYLGNCDRTSASISMNTYIYLSVCEHRLIIFYTHKHATMIQHSKIWLNRSDLAQCADPRCNCDSQQSWFSTTTIWVTTYKHATIIQNAEIQFNGSDVSWCTHGAFVMLVKYHSRNHTVMLSTLRSKRSWTHPDNAPCQQWPNMPVFSHPLHLILSYRLSFAFARCQISLMSIYKYIFIRIWAQDHSYVSIFAN